MVGLLKRNICIVLLTILVFVCALFPNDVFALKKISFALLLLINIKMFIENKLDSIVFLIGVALPIGLILQGILFGVPFGSVFGRSYCCFLFLLLPIIQRYNIDYKKVFMLGIELIIFLTLLIFLLDIVGIINVNYSSPIKGFIAKHGIGIMGKHSSYPAYYKIFIKTSPLIVFYLFNKIEEKKYIWAIIAYSTLVISGTRGNFVFSGLMIILYVVFSWEKKRRYDYLLQISIILIGILFIILKGNEILNQLYEMIIAKGESSDEERMGHYQGLIEMWNNKPLSFVVGTGMGSSFYSYGVNAYVDSIELPYLDLLRQMGIILFLFFLHFTFLPLAKLKSNRTLQFAYISYLLTAATNPLLFSSTAFLVFVYIFYEMKAIENKEK